MSCPQSLFERVRAVCLHSEDSVFTRVKIGCPHNSAIQKRFADYRKEQALYIAEIWQKISEGPHFGKFLSDFGQEFALDMQIKIDLPVEGGLSNSFRQPFGKESFFIAYKFFLQQTASIVLSSDLQERSNKIFSMRLALIGDGLRFPTVGEHDPDNMEELFIGGCITFIGEMYSLGGFFFKAIFSDLQTDSKRDQTLDLLKSPSRIKGLLDMSMRINLGKVRLPIDVHTMLRNFDETTVPTIDYTANPPQLLFSDTKDPRSEASVFDRTLFTSCPSVLNRDLNVVHDMYKKMRLTFYTAMLDAFLISNVFKPYRMLIGIKDSE